MTSKSLAWTVIWSAAAAITMWFIRDPDHPMAATAVAMAVTAFGVYLVSLWFLCRVLAPESKTTAVAVVASNVFPVIGLVLAAATAWKALRQPEAA